MTWWRRAAVALAGAGLLLGIGTTGAQAAQAPVAVTAGAATDCSAAFFDGDRRLGPESLPRFGEVGAELLGYQRTGGHPAAEFLATFYDPAANGGQGGWRYPPANGYLLGLGGAPIEFQLGLTPGADIDRFGSEYGSFLAPEGLPYATRSIPPASLDSVPAATCNYHEYRVLRPFAVDAGPIAPWFYQPGLGLQYQLDATLVPGAPSTLNVLWLVDNGYLARI